MTPAPVVFDPELHGIADFSCGRPSLDGRLRACAGSTGDRGPSRTFVSLASESVVVGYFTVVVSEITAAQATGAPEAEEHPSIAVALIARLAVDERRQHQGLGQALLLDALRRISRASEEVSVRAVLAQALDRDAQGFYRHFGFQPSGLEPDLLMVPMRSVRRVVGV